VVLANEIPAALLAPEVIVAEYITCSKRELKV
jgi:hypothetical protein